MSATHKLIYFSDAIFLGGAEEYLKVLVPGMNREKYQPRVALTRRPETRSLAEFFEREQIAVDFVETHSKSQFWLPFGAVYPGSWPPSIWLLNWPRGNGPAFERRNWSRRF